MDPSIFLEGFDTPKPEMAARNSPYWSENRITLIAYETQYIKFKMPLQSEE